MINIVPLEYYSDVFYHFMLIITLFLFFNTTNSNLIDNNNLKNKNLFGIFLLIIVLIYMGLRPVSYRFGDMVIYSKEFVNFVNGELPKYKKDKLFEFFLYSFSKLGSQQFFFFTCAFFYIVPLYWLSKKIFGIFWFYSFFILIASFSFWSYGTNGIRNGIATTLVLYAFSQKNKLIVLSLIIVSTQIHQSMYLILATYILTLLHNNNKNYLLFWILCIPLSLVLGGFFNQFFLTTGIIDQNDIGGYLGGSFNQSSENVILKTGFRWDFLLYSSSAVFAGWYFIYKKKFEDVIYHRLFNIYLFANGFWVLVIKANYSNRFAYLSWFMMGIIIIYPLLKRKFFINQHKVIGQITLLYFIFTYVLYFIS